MLGYAFASDESGPTLAWEMLRTLGNEVKAKVRTLRDMRGSMERNGPLLLCSRAMPCLPGSEGMGTQRKLTRDASLRTAVVVRMHLQSGFNCSHRVLRRVIAQAMEAMEAATGEEMVPQPKPKR